MLKVFENLGCFILSDMCLGTKINSEKLLSWTISCSRKMVDNVNVINISLEYFWEL